LSQNFHFHLNECVNNIIFRRESWDNTMNDVRNTYLDMTP
jgi:hypothetical protein